MVLGSELGERGLGAAGPRRKPIPGGSEAASMPLTVPASPSPLSLSNSVLDSTTKYCDREMVRAFEPFLDLKNMNIEFSILGQAQCHTFSLQHASVSVWRWARGLVGERLA